MWFFGTGQKINKEINKKEANNIDIIWKIISYQKMASLCAPPCANTLCFKKCDVFGKL